MWWCFLGGRQSDQNIRKITWFKEWSENPLTCWSKQGSSEWQIIWVAISNKFPQNCEEKLFKICQHLVKVWFESISLIIYFLTPVLFLLFLLCEHNTIKHLFDNCLNNYATAKYKTENILELIKINKWMNKYILRIVSIPSVQLDIAILWGGKTKQKLLGVAAKWKEIKLLHRTLFRGHKYFIYLFSSFSYQSAVYTSLYFFLIHTAFNLFFFFFVMLEALVQRAIGK